MRPHSFWSAALVYGVIFGLGVPIALWVLGAATGTPWRFSLLEFLFMVVVFGVLAGLGFAYIAGPATRTLNYEYSQDFRAKLEAALSSMHYQRLSESPSQLTYRISPPHGGLLPITADITVDKDAGPIRVTGPRNMLGQLEKKLRELPVRPGGIANSAPG